MTKLSEQILSLREEGKTYNEIKELTGASKGTISYHLGPGQKEKNSERQRKRHLDHVVRKAKHFRQKRVRKGRLTSSEISRLGYWKTLDFQRAMKGSGPRNKDLTFSFSDVVEKYGTKTVCYLTGREIDLSDGKQFNFDHIIPSSKGGSNTLDNLGIACPEANYAKGSLSVSEFVELCYDVVENFEKDQGLV